MIAKTNFSLKDYNTFGIDVKANQFIEVDNYDELKHILKRFYAEEVFILGGGSNMLLTKNISQTVLHINLKGIHVVESDSEHVIVDVEAGENWHEFVIWSIEKGYGGIENLSLIPGNVGSAPIQNIGAYGVELKDVFVSCDAIHRQTLDLKTFSKSDCDFGYRQSVFKNELKNLYIITKVRFKLTVKNHRIKKDYGAIQDELKASNIKTANPEDISKAVIKIRQSKLPDPKELGNSGSFFKNPIVDRAKFENLQKQNPDMPFYKIDENSIKIPAGWLIDQCGLKGYRDKDAGVHKKQALVLVNYGNASGQDILNLSKKVQNQVKDKFGIDLNAEVNII